MRVAARLLVLCSALILACGGDALSPADIAGSYSATSFVVTPTGQAPMDVLGAGGSLTLVLNANGTTTGQLSVPASVNGGTALVASMAGTYQVAGSVVTFDQTADTFVRDMNFNASQNTLQGAAVFSGASVAVTLTKP